MSSRLENTILEEIHRRVIEAERRQQSNSMWQIEKEVAYSIINEYSGLDEAQIDEIIKQVHAEVQADHLKTKRTTSYFLLGLLVVLFISAISSLAYTSWPFPTLIAVLSLIVFGYFAKLHYNLYRKRIIIIDNFDNNHFKWSVGKLIQQHRQIKDGRYEFEVGIDGRCYWDTVALNLPNNTDILCTVQHLSGKNSSAFGVVLEDKSNDYISFDLNNIGQASFVVRKNSEWAINKPWKNAVAKPDGAKNTLEIKVRGNQYSFWINNKRVFQENITQLTEPQTVGFRVCSEQKVAFHSLSVTNADTNRSIFFDDFKLPDEKWSPRQQGAYHKYFKNGKYYIETERNDWCYWSYEPVKLKGDFLIELKSTHISGENDKRGLVLYYSDKWYFRFELTPDGKAQYYQKATDYVSQQTQTEANSDGQTYQIQRVKIINGNFEYYVGNQLVHRGKFSKSGITRVGVSVCGHQTARFEKLLIEEL